MEDANIAGLRAELALLEAQEAQLSAKLRHLHNQSWERQRTLSDQRQRLWQRIAALRELLSTQEVA